MKNASILLSLSLILPAIASATTADFYKCTSKESGEWNFGRAPYVCDASAFGKDSVAYADYPNQVFADAASRTPERTRYVSSLFPVLRDAAKYYLLTKKPTATADEIKYWQLLVEVTSAHESRMSHYRKTTDTHLKMMRGDSGHGHGLMQIDDRSHLDAINQGQAWSLIENLTLGMDILYAGWLRAPSQSCVGSETNWTARIRSAWAQFNGGSGSICRWTNSASTWAANDTNFYDMYNAKSWMTYVADQNAAPSIDVQCMIENGSNCPAPGSTASTTVTPVANVLYQVSSSQYCVLSGGALHCVTTSGDALCLAYFGSSINTAESTALPSTAGYTIVNEDRHALCREYDPTLFAVGSSITTKKALALSATAGGTSIATVAANQTFSVIDFVVRTQGTNDRYYEITSAGVTGYVYAGTAATTATYVVAAVPVQASSTNVAIAGGSVTVVAASGINMRSTPGGTLQINIPKGTVLKVVSVTTQSSTNQIYYQVSYGGHTGYIYTGTLKPSDTTASWTKLSK